MALSDVSEQKRAVPAGSVPGIAPLLAGGLMLCTLAVALQNRHVVPPAIPSSPPAPVHAERAPLPAPVSPWAAREAQEDTMPVAALMQRWEPMISDAAHRFGVPAAWIRNVMRAESAGRTVLNGRPITSDRGAQGLMQLLPGTYEEMRAQYGLGPDIFNPHDNIYAGAAYLRWLYGKYGYPAMFAAYNDGPGKLEDHLFRGRPLPDETRAYVAGITRALGSGAEWLGGNGRVTVTRPDGSKLALDRNQIKSVRAALPGEYAPGVAAVIDTGKLRQGVKESADAILAALAPHHRGA